MNQPSTKRVIVLYFFLFYSCFYVIGLLLAYWFGMGWFILFHTIRGLFNSIPRINTPVLRFLIDPEFGVGRPDQEDKKISGWFTSKTAIIVNIINILLTILGFWKINIPLYVIVKMMGH